MRYSPEFGCAPPHTNMKFSPYRFLGSLLFLFSFFDRRFYESMRECFLVSSSKMFLELLHRLRGLTIILQTHEYNYKIKWTKWQKKIVTKSNLLINSEGACDRMSSWFLLGEPLIFSLLRPHRRWQSYQTEGAWVPELLLTRKVTRMPPSQGHHILDR